jgi:hypothetical protein
MSDDWLKQPHIYTTEFAPEQGPFSDFFYKELRADPSEFLRLIQFLIHCIRKFPTKDVVETSIPFPPGTDE